MNLLIKVSLIQIYKIQKKNEIAKLNPIVKQKEKINEKKIKSDEELLEERLSAIRAKKKNSRNCYFYFFEI